MNRADSLDIALGWGDLRALVWANPDGLRTVCLHGWMDNAASFGPLAPGLGALNLVAVDLAGHGQSDHRPEGCRYYFTDYLFDLEAALDEIGWDRCVLVGHSLGAGLAACFAAMVPACVERLVLLDGVGPLSTEARDAPELLRQSRESVRKPARHTRTYASAEDAARVRREKAPMAEESALLLSRRALTGDPGELRWRTDPRIRWTSPVRMSEPQVLALLSAIECPVLAVTTPVLAEHLGDRLEERLRAIPDVRHAAVDGGHHVHMDEPQGIANLILDFLELDGEAT